MDRESGARPTVLIVEDDVFLANIFERMLKLVINMYSIVSVSTAAEALAYCEEHAIKLVITDYKLHPMNGIDLTRALKQTMPSVPVLMITGTDPADITDDVSAAGVDLMLHKPFLIVDFQTAVLAMLSA